MSFVFFKDTFHREQSLSYQNALRLATKEWVEKLEAKAEKSRKRESYDDKERDPSGSVTPDMEAKPQLSLDERKLSNKEIPY
jgi:hypothetical protein